MLRRQRGSLHLPEIECNRFHDKDLERVMSDVGSSSPEDNLGGPGIDGRLV